MNTKQCPYEGYFSNCVFVNDTHNSNRYMCLKCGVERRIEPEFNWGIFLLLVLLGIAIAVILSV